MPTIDDLINAAENQSPTEFSNAFTDIMSQRIAGVVDDMKIAVAQNMFGEQDDEEVGEDEFEDDDSDEEVEDDEFEDDEWDDEELDDLEGLEDQDGEDA